MYNDSITIVDQPNILACVHKYLLHDINSRSHYQYCKLIICIIIVHVSVSFIISITILATYNYDIKKYSTNHG